jgi:hypothetical protein
MRWNTEIDTLVPATYNRGDIVSITGLLEEGTEYLRYSPYLYSSWSSPEDIMWAIVILSPTNTPFYVETGTLIDIEGNYSLDPVNVNIPSSAEFGTYKIRVIIWTDLLPTGETRTNIITEGSFEVVL